ncbi:hypothetical protein [Algoriphagus winogradskyi]|uniref:Predicted ABC-type ATPase n=1 Tax=Algoriphagus winogradskyi TaxID=237017 RepID=A0ABY1NWZ9_9BACT|nr:hypothetical protein [Algoriphagus winogradskyi]SMP19866.1 Predicted ABC-type ATPase [Algoriphagus winogradskyi]
MDKPGLWVIAGCNGAGKSSFSKALVNPGILPFDYDFHFLKIYHTLQSSEIQDLMGHNLAFEELQAQINDSILRKRDFCYETNFNDTPLEWPLKFRAEGYNIHLIYFVMNSIEEAKRRVRIRVENGGHFVPDSEIVERFYAGYSNLNDNFKFFDSIDVFDSSVYKREPRYCFSFTKGKLGYHEFFPKFLNELVPKLAIEFE